MLPTNDHSLIFEFRYLYIFRFFLKISKARCLATEGSIATVLKRAQLGDGMNLPPEFHQNRPTINGVLAWTDKQTDRQT